MELKVGMYVRFKDKRGNQYIRRIIDIPKDNRYASIYLDKEANYVTGVSLKNIKKASYDIIDLIEVGDYVNGEKVIALRKDINERDIHMNSKDCNVFTDYSLSENWYFGINDEDIKSIVTSQQFESISYKVD